MINLDFKNPLDENIAFLSARWEIRRVIAQYWQAPLLDNPDDNEIFIVGIAHMRGERIGNC